MRADLSAISFACAALLAVTIPVARVRCNIANLAIVAWLVGCNLVHGINTIIWDDNVDLHVPIWCDIVTKLLLGATVALPGACLSISRRLELVSSSRTISNDPKTQQRRLMSEFALCYIIPSLYMALHYVTQDHRFDLIQDYGCSASIHPSTLGLSLMWIPPMLLCFVSLMLSGVAIHHSFRMPAASFANHIESRSPYTSSIFVRRITISIITTCTLLVATLFSVFSVSVIRPWTSWDLVHADITVIDVVESQGDIGSIQLVWWGVPVVSMVYILLSFILGEECRDAFKWVRGKMFQVSKWRPCPLVLLPIHVNRTETGLKTRSPLSTPRPRPHTLDLKSGWDDMLDTEKKLKLWSPVGRKSPNSLRTASPHPSRAATPSPSPTIATSPTVCGEDEAFIASTLDYLVSPVAKSLGITPPALVLSPPPVYVSPGKATFDPTNSPTTPTTTPISPLSLHNKSPSPRCVPADVESVISSVFDAAWPQPPPSPPKLVAATSRHSPTSPSRCSSPAEAEYTFGSPLYPSITPPHKHSKPFQGSSISSISEIPVISSPQPRSGPVVKSLRKTLSREKAAHVAPTDIIYMTVVKEVV